MRNNGKRAPRGPWKAIRQEVKGHGRFKCREEEKGQRKCWAEVRRQSGRKEGAAEGRATCVERAPGRLVDRHNIRKSKQAFRAQRLFRHINKAVRREHGGRRVDGSGDSNQESVSV